MPSFRGETPCHSGGYPPWGPTVTSACPADPVTGYSTDVMTIPDCMTSIAELTLTLCMMLTVVYLAALVLHCTVLLHAEANMYEAGISAQHGISVAHSSHGISLVIP